MSSNPGDNSKDVVSTTLRCGDIRLVKAPSFDGQLSAPWPRQQDVSTAMHAASAEPEPEDLLVCVSHGWPYQTHPDPLGDKSAPLLSLLAEASAAHQCSGQTLVFFDFLSVTQRPRTAAEEASFKVVETPTARTTEHA